MGNPSGGRPGLTPRVGRISFIAHAHFVDLNKMADTTGMDTNLVLTIVFVFIALWLITISAACWWTRKLTNQSNGTQAYLDSIQALQDLVAAIQHDRDADRKALRNLALRVSAVPPQKLKPLGMPVDDPETLEEWTQEDILRDLREDPRPRPDHIGG